MVQDQLDRFYSYINERHAIYIRRQAGVKPFWTEDKILQTYSFCNVFRELDTVTIWLRENWKEPYADHPNLPVAMSVARQINWPDTLQEIGFPEHWNPDRVKAIMQGRMDRGDALSSYNAGASGTLTPAEENQILSDLVDQGIIDFIPPPNSSIRNSILHTFANTETDITSSDVTGLRDRLSHTIKKPIDGSFTFHAGLPKQAPNNTLLQKAAANGFKIQNLSLIHI